jgi:hypothetical protein
MSLIFESQENNNTNLTNDIDYNPWPWNLRLQKSQKSNKRSMAPKALQPFDLARVWFEGGLSSKDKDMGCAQGLLEPY